MYSNNIDVKKRYMKSAIPLLMGLILLFSCSKIGNTETPSIIFDYDQEDYNYLAMRFAPKLYLHADEPRTLLYIIPVHHPNRPMIAYHIIFDDDALFSGRGEKYDHEVLWVEYDPITYFAVDVPTLWHRTVIRTDTCLLDAKSSDQRPRVMIEWGLHGILPLGWKKLSILRVNAEIRMHWLLAQMASKVPGLQKNKVRYEGSFENFITYNHYVDSREFIKNQKVITAEYSFEELKERVDDSFSLKKEWPDW